MKRNKQLLGAVSATALVALSTSPAYAAGTTAGGSIANTVTVDYQVGGFNQTAATDTDTFVVDRKVDVTVAESGFIGRTSVSPNETQAVLQFDIQNLSNDVVDLDLSTALGAGNNFTPTNIQIWQDNGDGVFNAATDTLVTYLDEMAEDEIRVVFVTGDIPIGAATGDVADITLTATAHAGGGAASLGAVLTATAGANTAGVDTVLADGAGDTDAVNQGDFSDTDGFVVAAADVTVSKASVIISDPVNGTTNPKAIPGAVIEYCIAVSNGVGAATATAVSVSDTLPVDLEIDDLFGVFIDGTVDGGGLCNADGVDNANSNFTDNALGTPDQVSGTLSDIAAGVTRTLYFRATIN